MRAPGAGGRTVNAGEVVTLLTGRQVTARDGTTRVDWTDPVRVDVGGVFVAPRASTEPDAAGRAAPVISGLTLFMPAGTVISAHQRIEVRGVVYAVVGEPGDWRSPWSPDWQPGVEVALQRVEG